MGRARNRWAWVLAMLFGAAQASSDELWLVELEHDDGIHLQFQGAEVELGSATVWRQGEVWRQPLKPGDRLALLVADGVTTRIELLTARSPAGSGQWRRAEDRLQSFDERQLTLVALGTVPLNPQVFWINGSAADLHEGSELVLTRDEQGHLREILVVNPEE